MLKSEAGRTIVHCDRCNIRLEGEALPASRVGELAHRARLAHWQVERSAGQWAHICPAHPVERQGRFL